MQKLILIPMISTIRGFARTREAINGVSITAYGGIDILELVCIMSWGKLSRELDLDKIPIRTRHQNGRDQFAKIRFCIHCKSECMEDFSGKLLVVAGLNNVLKADRPPFMDQKRESVQNVQKLFLLMENTLKDLLPNAQIDYAVPLDVNFGLSPIAKEVYAKIKAEVEKRKHVEFDPSEPKRLKQFDFGGVHMIDRMSVEFWKKIINKL